MSDMFGEVPTLLQPARAEPTPPGHQGRTQAHVPVACLHVRTRHRVKRAGNQVTEIEQLPSFWDPLRMLSKLGFQ